MLHGFDNCHVILAFACRLWLLAGWTDLTEGNWHFEIHVWAARKVGWNLMNIQPRPVSLSDLVFLSDESFTCRDNKLLCKGSFFPFQRFMTEWKCPAPDLLLPCPGPEIIGITSFRDSYNGNEHVGGPVSGTADLISGSNKEQLPLKH